MVHILIVFSALIFALWKGVKLKEKKANLKNVAEPIRELQGIIRQASSRFNVPSEIISAVAWVESGGRMNAIGGAGEIGIMQLKQIAVNDVELNKLGEFPNWRKDSKDNIFAGTAFLRLQKNRVGNWEDAIRAYNQGEAGAKRYPERADEYLNKVLAKERFFK